IGMRRCNLASPRHLLRRKRSARRSLRGSCSVRMSRFGNGRREMDHVRLKTMEVAGRSGNIELQLSENQKRLLLLFDVDEKGLDKTDVNALIDELKRLRDRMQR